MPRCEYCCYVTLQVAANLQWPHVLGTEHSQRRAPGHPITPHLVCPSELIVLFQKYNRSREKTKCMQLQRDNTRR